MQSFLTNKTIEKLKYDFVREGLISYEDLSRAEELAKSSNTNLSQVLTRFNLISEEELLLFIEAKLHIPYVKLENYNLDQSCLNLISYEEAKNYRIIPLFKIEDVLTVAMTDPLNVFILDNLINLTSYKIEPIICAERTILQAIDKYYLDSNIDKTNLNIEKIDWKLKLSNENIDRDQIKDIIYSIINQAVIENIHEIVLEQDFFDGLAISFKKNKELIDEGNIPVLLAPLFISELKIISNLDPAISEVPQLGKFAVSSDKPDSIIINVSTFPTQKGERIVIKIYKPPKKLEELNLDNAQLDFIKNNLYKSGIILVSGSALSGKTSVIYAILSAIDSKTKNIMTIESTIKYDLSDINQCELNEKVGFNIDKAIRYIDFQSPDVIYLEEILNQEGIDFVRSLVHSGNLVIIEFSANSQDSLLKRLEDAKFNALRKLILFAAFVDDKANIEIISLN